MAVNGKNVKERMRRALNNIFGLMAAALAICAATVVLTTLSNASGKGWDTPYTSYTKAGLPRYQSTTIRRELTWDFGAGILSVLLFGAAYVLEIKEEAIRGKTSAKVRTDG